MLPGSLSCALSGAGRGATPPGSCLLEYRTCRAALCFAECLREFVGEARFFVRAEESRDRQLLAARNQKQPVDAKFFYLDFIQSEPERIEHPFAHTAEMAHFANPEYR